MEAVVVELAKNSVSNPQIEPVSKVINLKEVNESEKTSETTQDGAVLDINLVDFTELVKNVTDVVQALGTKVSFSFDDRTPNPVIKVMDDESGKQVRQIPREEMLHLMSKLREVSGLIFARSI
ncbi:MAG: flagellar protein FlaG [Candidatus Marinimicrobia bacterium]|nr:flagellar protein FlaG [Candidatus Neomarinimicrobiota bacterium]